MAEHLHPKKIFRQGSKLTKIISSLFITSYHLLGYTICRIQFWVFFILHELIEPSQQPDEIDNYFHFSEEEIEA